LEGSTLTRIVAKKLKSSITPGSGKLIKGGLIKRRMKMPTSGRRGNGARLAYAKVRRDGINARGTVN
jgi:hypothetical protein